MSRAQIRLQRGFKLSKKKNLNTNMILTAKENYFDLLLPISMRQCKSFDYFPPYQDRLTIPLFKHHVKVTEICL